MNARGEWRLRRAIYGWRIASGFCAVAAFTVIFGYHLPLRRELGRLHEEQVRSHEQQIAAQQRERAEGEAEAARERELAQLRAENGRLSAELDALRRRSTETSRRIEDLGKLVADRFQAELRDKRMAWASADDRVSIAVAMPALFPGKGSALGKDGQALLCAVAETVLSYYGGQIRVTGYYGADKIADRALARAYPTPWELSAARAASATAALERECNASRQRFLAVGYGPRSAGALGPNVAFEFVMSDSG